MTSYDRRENRRGAKEYYELGKKFLRKYLRMRCIERKLIRKSSQKEMGVGMVQF